MNWNLLGHEWAVEMLRGKLQRSQPGHAYLITGPEGVGKRTLGLRLGAALNCLTPVVPGEPCFTCRNCRLIERMQHPDLSVVQAEEIGGTLKVDQVRELQRQLSLAPYEAAYRVALLLRFEEAHPSAANALLKMLEEPPARVIFILTAENAERLLETIVSRCEVLRLRPLPLALAMQGLQERWGIPPEQATLLAHLANGRIGYAVRLHQDGDFLDRRERWLDDLMRLLPANRVERFSYAESQSRDRAALRLLFGIWLTFWRDVLLVSGGAAVPLTNVDREAQVRLLAERLSLKEARQMVSRIEEALFALDGNANTRLVLEVFLLDLPVLQALPI